MTHIHLIAKNTTPQPHSAQWNPASSINFTKHTAPPSITVQDLIDVIRREDDPDRDEGIQEIFEAGDGKWVAGTRYRRGTVRAKETLQSIGWGAERGTKRKPVWLVFGKAD